MKINHKAAKYVTGQSVDTDEALMFLEALGIYPPDPRMDSPISLGVAFHSGNRDRDDDE